MQLSVGSPIATLVWSVAASREMEVRVLAWLGVLNALPLAAAGASLVRLEFLFNGNFFLNEGILCDGIFFVPAWISLQR